MRIGTRKRLSWMKRLFLAGWGLAIAATTTFAQDRPAPKSYLNKGTVHLPIQIDDRVRPQIQEVQLFVKENPQAPWTLKERVPGTQPFFTFRTTQEGEYWFSVVTVDRNGRAVPADITKEPPGLVVVIDSTPPQPDVQIQSMTAEGQQIHCEIRDSNPDPAKTRFFYQTRDQIWRSLDAMAGKPDTFCIPAQAAVTGMVRVVAADLAGNSTTREFNLATAPVMNNVAAAPALPSPHAGDAPAPLSKGLSNVSIVDPLEGSKTASEKSPLPPLPDLTPVSGQATAPKTSAIPAVEPPAPTPGLERAAKTPFSVPSNPEPRPSEPRTFETRNVEVRPIESRSVETRSSETRTSETRTSDTRTIDTPELGSGKQLEVPGKRHLVNNSHVFLDYQVDQTGVSGVGRVEIWYTRNLGQSWQKIGEDIQHKGQAEVDLPGEGIYGVSIVVANGRGFGATPPKSGDTPDWWIEVDTTRPQAELLGVRTNPTGDDGTLHITWTAKDKNLHPDPIDLYYAVNRQGPWLPIAKGLKNDGIYHWSPAATIGTHAFIRLTVHDLAGNSSSCESLQPVPLDDMSRPRGRVVGVTTVPRTNIGGAPGSLAPSGN